MKFTTAPFEGVITLAKKSSGFAFRTPSAEPLALLKLRNRPLTNRMNCAGPAAPMVSGGKAPVSFGPVTASTSAPALPRILGGIRPRFRGRELGLLLLVGVALFAGSVHPGRGKYLVKTGERPGLPVALSLVGEEWRLYDTDMAIRAATRPSRIRDSVTGVIGGLRCCRLCGACVGRAGRRPAP